MMDHMVSGISAATQPCRTWWHRATRTFVWRLTTRWPWRELPWSQRRIVSACQTFRREREYLEAEFVRLGRTASVYGLPCWRNATFDDRVVFIQNNRTGELLALVVTLLELDVTRPYRPQNIGFREFGKQIGETPKNVPNKRAWNDGPPSEFYGLSQPSTDGVSRNIDEVDSFSLEKTTGWQFQDATAIFRFTGAKWCTDGHCVLDCIPEDIVVRYRESFRVL